MFFTVSIITPTTPDRAQYIQRLQGMIAAQTVQPLEWLVDSAEGTIGAKRNRLCEAAKGDVIVHMDSDDLYAPDWIEVCLNNVQSGEIVGLSNAYFYDTTRKVMHEYKYKGQLYIVGATMCYRKSVWKRKKFEDTSSGEDTKFITGRKLFCHGHKNSFIATVHGSNTACHKAIPMMQQVKIMPDLLRQLNGQ